MKLAIAKIFSCPIFLPPYSDFHSDRPKFFAAFSAPPSPDSVKGQQEFTKIYPDTLKEALFHGSIVSDPPSLIPRSDPLMRSHSQIRHTQFTRLSACQPLNGPSPNI